MLGREGERSREEVGRERRDRGGGGWHVSHMSGCSVGRVAGSMVGRNEGAGVKASSAAAVSCHHAKQCQL